MSKRLRVLISGGGTGGHIFPALAIADALRVVDPSIDILFVGARGKMEMQRIPKAGYPIKGLWISGFQRRLSWRNLLFPLKLVVSGIQALFILMKFRPDIVLGVGGYASGPIVFIAGLFGVKTAIQEQNALPGATNRLLGKRVDRIYTAYPDLSRFFDLKKTYCTGNPVRAFIGSGSVEKLKAASHFGLSENKKTILVFGGSLGAGIFNECMENAADLIEAQSHEVQWIWQSGQSYAERYSSCRTAQMENVRFLPFIDTMDFAYAMADLVICRAGAMAIAELALLGKAVILVPSPFVAEDHQTVNARSLESAGGALLIRQQDAPQMLIKTALALVHKENELEGMRNEIIKFAHPDAANQIAQDVLKIIKAG